MIELLLWLWSIRPNNIIICAEIISFLNCTAQNTKAMAKHFQNDCLHNDQLWMSVCGFFIICVLPWWKKSKSFWNWEKRKNQSALPHKHHTLSIQSIGMQWKGKENTVGLTTRHRTAQWRKIAEIKPKSYRVWPPYSLHRAEVKGSQFPGSPGHFYTFPLGGNRGLPRTV